MPTRGLPFLDRLERIFGRFAIPGLPLIAVALQILVWLGLIRGLLPPSAFLLHPLQARAGEWWRLATFVVAPLGGGLLTKLMAWWLFYLTGTALEGFWGTFRFNVFLLSAYVLTVGAAFLVPYGFVDSWFIGAAVPLAFAYLNPNFEVMILFILPVQVKWLAMLTWLLLGAQFVRGDGSIRAQIFSVLANFLLFFGQDLWLTIKLKSRAATGAAAQAAPARAAAQPRHRCRICGKTDRSNPELDFRYCSRCAGDPCYCPEHIFNHEHLTTENEPGKPA